jgi:hypothetical protein
METNMKINITGELTNVGGRILDLIDAVAELQAKNEELVNTNTLLIKENERVKTENEGLKLKLKLMKTKPNETAVAVSELETFAQQNEIKMTVVPAAVEVAAAAIIEEKKEEKKEVKTNGAAAAASGNITAVKPTSFKNAVKGEDKETDARRKQEEEDAAVAMRLQHLETPGATVVDPRPFKKEQKKKNTFNREVDGGFDPTKLIIDWIDALKNPSNEEDEVFEYPEQFTCDKRIDNGAFNLFKRIGAMVHRMNEFVKDSEKDNNIALNDGEMTISNAKSLIFGNLNIENIFTTQEVGKQDIFVLTPEAIAEIEKIKSNPNAKRAALLMGQYINKVINPELSA